MALTLAALMISAFNAASQTPPLSPEERPTPASQRLRGYETPPVLKASELLPPRLLAGEHYRVAEEVINDGYTNHFIIDSEYGSIPAAGSELLRIRIQEVTAITALRKMRKRAAFGKGLGNSLKDLALSPYRTVKKIVKNPLHLVAIVPEEAGRVLGIVGEVRIFVRRGSAGGAVKEFIGYYGANSDLAEKLAVDPNSSNEVLQADLQRVVWPFYAGGAPLRLADSIIPALSIPRISIVEGGGSLATVVDAAADRIAGRTVKSGLRRMDVEEKIGKRFRKHAMYSSGQRRALVGALSRVENAEGRTDFFELAVRANTPFEANRFLHLAEMIAGYHSRVDRVESVHVVGEHVLLGTQGGKLIAPIHYDHLVWTRIVARSMVALGRANSTLSSASSREVWISGRMSSQCRRKVESLGFSVREEAWEALEANAE